MLMVISDPWLVTDAFDLIKKATQVDSNECKSSSKVMYGIVVTVLSFWQTIVVFILTHFALMACSADVPLLLVCPTTTIHPSPPRQCTTLCTLWFFLGQWMDVFANFFQIFREDSTFWSLKCTFILFYWICLRHGSSWTWDMYLQFIWIADRQSGGWFMAISLLRSLSSFLFIVHFSCVLENSAISALCLVFARSSRAICGGNKQSFSVHSVYCTTSGRFLCIDTW